MEFCLSALHLFLCPSKGRLELLLGQLLCQGYFFLSYVQSLAHSFNLGLMCFDCLSRNDGQFLQLAVQLVLCFPQIKGFEQNTRDMACHASRGCDYMPMATASLSQKESHSIDGAARHIDILGLFIGNLVQLRQIAKSKQNLGTFPVFCVKNDMIAMCVTFDRFRLIHLYAGDKLNGLLCCRYIRILIFFNKGTHFFGRVFNGIEWAHSFKCRRDIFFTDAGSSEFGFQNLFFSFASLFQRFEQFRPVAVIRDGYSIPSEFFRRIEHVLNRVCRIAERSGRMNVQFLIP